MMIKTLISENTADEESPKHIFEAIGAKAPRTVNNEKYSLFTYLAECV